MSTFSETRNTKITYLYRDGSNNKIDASVIFSGAITLAERDRLVNAMLPAHDDDLFGTIIPGQVGLPDLQDQFGRREIAILEALLAPQAGPVNTTIDAEQRARYETLLEEARARKPQWLEDDDHIFHEVTDIGLTEGSPTDPRSIQVFISDVEKVTWDETWRPAFHAEMVENRRAALECEGESEIENG